MSDLQAMVDAMADALDRPVGVDDARFRLLAHSAHREGQPVDAVRLAKLLRREANAQVKDWLERHGVREAGSFVRVPRCEELDMAARIIAPLRFDGDLLGFLALIDEPEPFSEEELAEALGYVEDLSLALFRTHRLGGEGGDGAADRVRAALEDGRMAPAGEPLLPAAPLYACVVARAAAPDGSQATPEWAIASMAASLRQARQWTLPGHSVALVEEEAATGAFALAGAEELDSIVSRLSSDLEARLGEHPDWHAAVGVGAPVAALGSLRRSFLQARHAARLASLGGPGRVARWPELGADGTIASLLGEADPAEFVPGSLQALLRHPDAEALIQTARAYLDQAGDTGGTAAALFIHRTSLYHRLRRIEAITGLDLSSGDGRLELHLGLRLWRMAS